MTDKEPVSWITVNGVHVPLFDGESKQDAINRVVAKDATDKMSREIKSNQAQATVAEKQLEKPTKLKQENESKFSATLKSAKDSRPIMDKWRVDEHTAEQLKERGCKCFSSSGGSTVAVDRDGDIISVCKKAGDKSVSGKDLLAEAVKMGGKKLDSFAGNHEFYAACGFEPIAYTPFNIDYAPDGWKDSGCGQEEVIFYKYVGVGNVKNTDLETFLQHGKKFTGDDGYDKAMEYRNSKI